MLRSDENGSVPIGSIDTMNLISEIILLIVPSQLRYGITTILPK